MKKWVTFLMLLAAVSASGGLLVAHHGTGISYDMSKTVTLKGTITEIAWRNPHVSVFIDVKDSNGKVVNWGIENSNVATLAAAGYNRNTLKPGQEVTAIVNPSRSGANVGVCVKVILAGGKETFVRHGGDNE